MFRTPTPILIAFSATAWISTAWAGPPKVMTDIPPVHSLAAKVMGDLGEPGLIVPPGVSPHDHAMRPSEAAALQEADAVIWIGPRLTPKLERPIKNIGEGAQALTLLDAPGMRILDYRKLEEFWDGDDHDGHDDEHHDEEHEDEHGHGHHGHDHSSGIDPHIWLDPANGNAALMAIAELLAGQDPANAKTYRNNARQAQRELDALDADLRRRMAALSGQPFMLYHDAYQYFEARYGIAAIGSITIGDAETPGPTRLGQIRDRLGTLDVGTRAVCVFSEPQHPEKLVAMLADETGLHRGVLDPLGTDLKPGPDLYDAVLNGLAESFESCLDPAS